MKTFRILLALLFMCQYAVIQAQDIVSEQSEINFKTTGGGIFKVKGTFSGMKGEFNLNVNDLENSGFDICIDAETIDTKNKKRDAHLKNEDFFDVELYPTICFVSNAVVKSGDGFITSGELTLHGVTKTVDIPFEFKNNTFTGTFEVNRFDYKLGEDFGTMRVGTMATITITCVVK